MLGVSHGRRIRTEKEFHILLTKCGFEIANINTNSKILRTF